MRLSPQQRQVLTELERAWPSGVHSHALHALPMADPAARISDLRRLGYEIRIDQANRNGRNGKLYTLHRPEYGANSTSTRPSRSGGSTAVGRPARATQPAPAAVHPLPAAGRTSEVPEIRLVDLERAIVKAKDIHLATGREATLEDCVLACPVVGAQHELERAA